MAMKKTDISNALDLLEKFERQVIDPEKMSWNYLVEHVGFSRATLWRNEKIKDKYGEVTKYLVKVKSASSPFTYEKQQHIKTKQRIDQLKLDKERMQIEIDTLKEQLAYVAYVATQKELDPAIFFKAPKLIMLKDV